MRPRLVLLMVLGAALVPVVALGASSTKLTANMVGATEVPKGDPNGHATAAITITGPKVCWRFTSITGIDKPLAAHIHKGRPGVAGPIVVPFGAAFKPFGCIVARAAVARAIAATPSAYYVNIHTKKYPAGAVRAQLRKATSSTY